MQKAWKAAVYGTVLGVAFVSSASAGITIFNKHMIYTTYQHPMGFPEYEVARSAMAAVYKNTQYERGPGGINPFIDITQFDLNDDKVPEMIAAASDSEIEEKPLCTADAICPHYILQFREGEKEPHNLGIIQAQTVDRGEEIKNGYWTLIAINAQRDENQKPYYDTYAYDKKLDKYVKEKGEPKVLEDAPTPQLEHDPQPRNQ